MLVRLRNNINLARWVLLWFVLSLGFAVAAPIVSPQSVEMVCTNASSMKLIVQGQDGKALNLPSIDCPLCAMVGAPPPAPINCGTEPAPALTQAFDAIYIARIAALTMPPLPARGPPAHA
jgi:hypothetical protein